MLAVPRSATGGAWQPPAPEELQRSFPQYEIQCILGRGGMGAVYKAWQKNLERHVAIKILPAGIDDDGMNFAERFKQEARAMAKFKHPGIVAVYDAGETPEGLLYFVMEYVEGTDLAQLVATHGRLPPEQALAITAHICAALAYAHGHGVVHRDIKPSNVMVAPDGTVKVADFGLAKFSSGQSAMHTMNNVAIGTPDFMPPESLLDPTGVDHRADLYGVGGVLYQMLTGLAPHGRFDPPSRVVPGLDKRLDRVVDKAMQADREQRYATAIELQGDVTRIIPGGRGASTATAGTAADIIRHPLVRKVTIGLLAATAIGVAAVEIARAKNRRSETPSANNRQAETKPPGAAETPGKPDVPPPAPPVISPATATKDAPFENTLGMKFVPVPITGGPTDGKRVLFSIWETRVQDYEVFTKETGREWKKPAFSRDPTHPVMAMSWDDAKAFCSWLTEAERKTGRLGVTEGYRLPTDHEWSCAIGIGELEDPKQTPREKSCRIVDVYPWGSYWPPPPGSGNFSGEESPAHRNDPARKFLANYRDGYPDTAPVGSFAANRLGLFDLDGNVREWCEDLWDADESYRVVRGSAFNDAARLQLLSSRRVEGLARERFGSRGFRPVLEVAPSTLAAGTAAWRDAFAESPLKEVLAKAAHTPQGFLLPGGNHWKVPSRSMRSGALRVRATSPDGHFVCLCIFLDDGGVHRVRFRDEKKDCVLSHGAPGESETDIATKGGISVSDGRPHDVVLARLSGRLRVSVDGVLLHEVADPSPAPGRFALTLFSPSRISVEKAEYLDLDGINDSDARQRLGIARE